MFFGSRAWLLAVQWQNRKNEEYDSLQTVEISKKEKSNAKAAFTRVQHQLLQLLEDLPVRTEIETQRYNLNDAQEVLSIHWKFYRRNIASKTIKKVYK